MNNNVCTQLARTVGARLRCLEMDRDGSHREAIARHESILTGILLEFPSGSGFDAGTQLDKDGSTGERLVFTTAFHHMNENGLYDGWTNHKVIVTPSLEMGCRIKITGRDRNEIKDYIGERFQSVLSKEWKGGGE